MGGVITTEFFTTEFQFIFKALSRSAKRVSPYDWKKPVVKMP